LFFGFNSGWAKDKERSQIAKKLQPAATIVCSQTRALLQQK
jgi:hypothetical protein